MSNYIFILLFSIKLLQYIKEKKEEHIKEEVGVVSNFKPSKNILFS